jgi:tetratricopeptide (TPR) repeat protein
MKSFFCCFFILLISKTAISQHDGPINSGELFNKADQLYDSGEYKKAIALYDLIDRNDTNYVKSLYGRAINYEADSQYNKGMSYCEEALKLTDQREMEPSIYNAYGNLLGT